MKKPVITAVEAARMVKDNDVVLIGGFLTVGSPEKILIELAKCNVKELTVVGNDDGFAQTQKDGTKRIEGIGRLSSGNHLKKVIASYIGANEIDQERFNKKDLEMDLTPQGTLIEQIRAGGMGLGGILTPTGVGTLRAQGKEVLKIDGKDYLLEKPIHANVALLHAKRADRFGNLRYHATARNFNPVMATAADLVIVEVEELIDGHIDPDQVETPGMFVDHLVF